MSALTKPVVFLALIAALLLVPVSTADDLFDVVVKSDDFQPGHPVNIEVTGPVNMTFNLQVTDENRNIIAGRDDQLDATGKFVFMWSPSQEGNYNTTVTFATGLTISKTFLIQQKVTTQDIAELYRSLFDSERRLLLAMKESAGRSDIALMVGVTSLITSVGLLVYTRKNFSRGESEFEKFLKNDVEGVLRKLIEERNSPPS
jgi:hypothetical protein